MSNQSSISAFLSYLRSRPLILKLIDFILVVITIIVLSGAYIVATNFGELFLKETVPPQFVETVSSQKTIHKILESAQDSTGADRTVVALFHNGTYGITKLSFFFYTSMYEILSPGVSPAITHLTRIPVGVDSHIEELINSKKVLIKVYEVPETTAVIHTYKTLGAEVVYRVMIYNLKDEPLGFIEVHYLNKNDADRDKYESLVKYASALSGILDEIAE